MSGHGPPRKAELGTDVWVVVRRACGGLGSATPGPTGSDTPTDSETLRLGAPLHEIGQVLRHRDLETTAIYAKVDFEALATVIRPRPGRWYDRA
jgi:integrase/recombinase XerD